MIAWLRQRYTVPHEPQRSERRVELAVFVLALIVLLQLLWLIGRYVTASQVRPVPPARDSLAVVSRTQPATPTPQQSMEMLARPVFFASRRPLDPLPENAGIEGAAENQKKIGSLKGLKVLGIVANGDRSRVIINFKGEQQRLAKGESIAGWRLTEVAPGRVVLENGEERDERNLSPMPLIASAAADPVDGRSDDTAAMSAAADARMQEQQEQGRENAVRALSAGGGVMNRTSGDRTQ